MQQPMSISLCDLLAVANEAYHDGYLAHYFDPETEEYRQGSGDTLAEFIVRELIDTFRPEASSEDKLRQAGVALSKAVRDLNKVIYGIESFGYKESLRNRLG